MDLDRRMGTPARLYLMRIGFRDGQECPSYGRRPTGKEVKESKNARVLVVCRGWLVRARTGRETHPTWEADSETGRSAQLTDRWAQRMRKVLISQDFQGWLTGLEPATSRSTIWRSNRLSYSHRVTAVDAVLTPYRES